LRVGPASRYGDSVAIDPGLRVLGEDGAPVPLAALWRDRPAVIALVRHFG
jgi:hypothetical protein